jgi:hypothetical protein
MIARNKTILFIFFQITALTSFAQRIIDSIPVCNLPVRKGVVYQYDRRSLSAYHRGSEMGVSIMTNHDSVFHFDEGRVVAVSDYSSKDEPGFMVVIRNARDDFFAYGNLRFVPLKKGDIVKKGLWIGLTAISADGNEKQLDFMYLKGKKQIPFKKTVEYVRCAKSCELPPGQSL